MLRTISGWMVKAGHGIAIAALSVATFTSLGAQSETGPIEANGLVSQGFEGSGETVQEAAALAPGLTPDSEIEKLPSIEAKLGMVRESVCGADTRTKHTVTTTYPQRTACQLILTLPDNSKAIGTGFLVGKGTVITAGHCVHTGGPSGGFMKKIEVIPGRNGTATGSRPFGTIVSSNLRTTTAWANTSTPNSDYGGIILSTKIGNTTGWLGFGAYSDATLQNLTVNTFGYPADKPTGTQWFSSGPISSLTANRLFYSFDTAGGQSGSAVYRIVNGSRLAVGVHAYGGCPNGATRINSGVFTNLSKWKTQGGG